MGLLDGDRLWNTVIGGAGGTLVGAGVGYLVGSHLWDDPEGKWAGAAIGSGAGMVLGSLIGLVFPTDEDEAVSSPAGGALPIVFRIRF